MLQRAKSKAEEMGRIRNSILRGKGNVAGFIGEEMVLKAFNNFKSNNTYDSDVLFRVVHFEIKTKRCNSIPLPNYACSVASSNISQKAPYYIFCRVLNTMDKGWIVGYMNKEIYFKKAIFLKKGDKDPYDPKFTVKADCFNVPILKLKDPQILVQLNDLKFSEKIIAPAQLTFQPCV